MMDFADVLLPGDGLFPSARGAELALPLLARLDEAGLLEPLQAAVNGAGGPLGALGAAERCAVVARVEAAEPKLFASVLKTAYLTYYEQPAVIAAIRAIGHACHAAPLPEGYPGEPFDFARDAPRHGRGRWLREEEVVRVDLSGLDYAGRRLR